MTTQMIIIFLYNIRITILGFFDDYYTFKPELYNVQINWMFKLNFDKNDFTLSNRISDPESSIVC